MKLYNVVGSPNCRKVLAAAGHLGIALDIEYLDFFAGDLMRPGYAALNPNRMVPTLTDGDLVLWESNAIMQYLADSVPGNRLFPAERKTRADIVRWQCWELAHFNKAFGVLSFEAIAKPLFMKQEGDKEVIRIAQRDLARHAPALETHMKDRQFLLGDEVTLADYSMIHLEGFQAGVPFDWTPYPNLNAYFERGRALPHWHTTVPTDTVAVGRKPA